MGTGSADVCLWMILWRGATQAPEPSQIFSELTRWCLLFDGGNAEYLRSCLWTCPLYPKWDLQTATAYPCKPTHFSITERILHPCQSGGASTRACDGGSDGFGKESEGNDIEDEVTTIMMTLDRTATGDPDKGVNFMVNKEQRWNRGLGDITIARPWIISKIVKFKVVQAFFFNCRT